jgi:hypothetical protein
MVAQMEADSPGTRHGLLRMADNIKALRHRSPEEGSKIAPPTPCPACGAMTSGSQCKACDFRALLND